ncbi:MAG: hypothetical protein KC543_13710 [Myxococcales bacterium]|nr:hypothetical protein [Myxococcales bacterium]
MTVAHPLRRATSRRALVVAACALVAGCATTEAPSAPVAAGPVAAPDRATTKGAGTSRPPTRAERLAIDQLAREAERVRGLRFRRPVEVEVHDGARIAADLAKQIEQKELDKARAVYGALGLLDPALDLRAMLEHLLAEQVVGYYDPERKELVVRDDVIRTLRADRIGHVDAASDEARLVLIHELIHALQDQDLGLGERYRAARDTDAENAFRSVIEGDATLGMLAAALQRQGVPLDRVAGQLEGMLGQIDLTGPLAGEALRKAPAIVRVGLVAPYIDGAQLMARIYAQLGWAGVNDAVRHPPPTMTQVMHPEKLWRGQLPDRITLPRFRGIEQAGYVSVDEDTLGELELGVYFGQGLRGGVDARAAEGWSGDRVRVYARRRAPEDHPTAAVWFSAWERSADAARALRAARRVAGLRGADDQAYAARRGRALLIIRGLPHALMPEVRADFVRFARGLPKRPGRHAHPLLD